MQSATAAPSGNWTKNSPGYQTLLVFLLSLNFGIVFFDRQAHNVLMPQIQPDLMLTQTQIGLIAGGLSFSWAIAAFFVGKLSDTLETRVKVELGRRKGKITVEFGSIDDLERIIAVIAPQLATAPAADRPS